MMRIAIEDLPEGFHVVGNTVIYDVTVQTFGTWTGVERVGDQIRLFPERSYRHKDLARKLGLADD